MIHLPECWLSEGKFDAVCICDRLRACEQRTLNAALEAVEAVENDPDAEVDYDRDYAADPTGNCRNPRIWLRSALAAIDALRAMNHLADCDDYAFSGAGFHPNCERICICRQVRRVEQRVLDAAREAVDSMVIDTVGNSAAEHLRNKAVVSQALAAIDALKEKP